MINLGAVEAMNLDGGASSALYANGSIITQPGRKLSTVLAVYDDYVIKASSNGIVNGNDGLFMPQANITREEMATVIYRLMQ